MTHKQIASVLRDAPNHLEEARYACHAISLATYGTFVNLCTTRNPVQTFFRSLYWDDFVSETKTHFLWEKCASWFGPASQPESQDRRIWALLLAAEIAETGGLDA